jgi:transposase
VHERQGELSQRGPALWHDHATVRKWVASYEAHGAAGLSKKFSHYDAEFKLSVLKRMWEDGLSCRQTAALFNIRNASCLWGLGAALRDWRD